MSKTELFIDGVFTAEIEIVADLELEIGKYLPENVIDIRRVSSNKIQVRTEKSVILNFVEDDEITTHYGEDDYEDLDLCVGDANAKLKTG